MENTLTIPAPSLLEQVAADDGAHTDDLQAPPPAGSIEESLATAKVVGYRLVVPEGKAATCREIEILVYRHLHWEM